MRAGSDGKGPLQYAVSRLSAVSVSVCAASPLRMTCDRWSHGEWWGGRRSQRRKSTRATVCLCGLPTSVIINKGSDLYL